MDDEIDEVDDLNERLNANCTVPIVTDLSTQPRFNVYKSPILYKRIWVEIPFDPTSKVRMQIAVRYAQYVQSYILQMEKFIPIIPLLLESNLPKRTLNISNDVERTDLGCLTAVGNNKRIMRDYSVWSDLAESVWFFNDLPVNWDSQFIALFNDTADQRRVSHRIPNLQQDLELKLWAKDQPGNNFDVIDQCLLGVISGA